MGGGIGNQYRTLCTIARGYFKKLKTIWSQDISKLSRGVYKGIGRARLHK